jgi:hypothetical protein
MNIPSQTSCREMPGRLVPGGNERVFQRKSGRIKVNQAFEKYRPDSILVGNDEVAVRSVENFRLQPAQTRISFPPHARKRK